MATSGGQYPVVALAALLASLESGSRPVGGVEARQQGIPSIGGEHINRDGSLMLDDVKRIPQRFFEGMRRGVLAPGDVLVNKDGAQTGKVARYRGEFQSAAINEHVFLLRANSALATSDFLFWSLLSRGAQRQIARLITGSAQPGLKQAFVTDVVIPHPPIKDQPAITAVLDTIDTAARSSEILINKLIKIRIGLLESLFTGQQGSAQGRHSRDVDALPTDLVDLPAGWDAVPLEVATNAPVCYGIVQAGAFFPNGPFVLTIGDLSGDFRSGLHRTSPAIDRDYARSRVREGDLLLSIKGTIGRTAIVPTGFEGNISRDLARLRLAPGFTAGFVDGYLQSPSGRRRLERAVVGTTRPEVSIHVLKQFKIPAPPIREQEKVASTLAAIDGRLRAERLSAAKLRLMRDGVMDELMPGRARFVRRAAASGGKR